MSTIKWHPFPQEKPETEGFYLVTIRNETTGAATIDLDHWGIHTPGGEPDFLPHKGYSILAWAESPKPYEPPEPDRARQSPKTYPRMRLERGRTRRATPKQ